MKYKHALVGKVSFAVLTISLLSLVLLAPITNAPPAPPGPDSLLPTPTPFGVGGEYVPVSILQLLAPYLIIAALGAAALALLILSKKSAS